VILRRVLVTVLALAIFAGGAVIALIALGFALYALVEPALGPAGAAAVVALVMAATVVIMALVLMSMGRGKPAKTVAPGSGNLIEQALAFVKQNPVMVVSAALGAGFLAIRNPKYLGAALRGFLEGERPK
jgi:hypothetical protein